MHEEIGTSGFSKNQEEYDRELDQERRQGKSYGSRTPQGSRSWNSPKSRPARPTQTTDLIIGV